MNGIWNEVRVITKSEAVEPVSGIFYGLNCEGVAIEDPNDILTRKQGPLTWDFADLNIFEYKGNAAVVKGYFDKDEDMAKIVRYIEEKVADLKDMGIDVGEGKVLDKEIYEQDWANNWKKYYKPTKISEKIVVKPTWEDYKVSEGEIVVELDPGMAFGTGTHETTRMCVKALEEHVKAESTVFDIGTGSGILAIAASVLGAKEVVAVDLDPVAVDAAKENVGINKAQNITVLEGNLMDVVEGKADIIVANIIADIIKFVCADVKNFLKPEGKFICSGIILDRRQDVEEKLREVGYKIAEVKNEGEWVCIVCQL
ncbi:ribosomal protein L11 methyltransferase [Hathewaya proteolytica DSM 3090]|uniref:Ribosomal protein L11 methyltransferase n=1 Tax=Hathewaya proteolytica DSM 3090 TaxID=1121331 RepID=A0A1M6JGT0_9CLOT|nr:50S ribosomal protein L11 methyltransferase [Hathewaya proteolytica]SHJ45812.1 ribosomal protein L11 methyltransferase [Hathewaya proteolytica DSM 3090]